MKKQIFAAIAALTIIATPAFASATQPALEGSVKGTPTSPAAGEVRVVSNDGQQFIKFGEKFSVSSQAETEVRLIDGKTGKQTMVGHLTNRQGAQVYAIPKNLIVDSSDRIVLYSPLRAEDLATVDLQVE